STGSSTSSSSGGSCPPQTSMVTASKISLPVTWPASGGVTQAGTGTAFIWLLANYPTINGNMLSGTTAICKIQLPDVMLNGAVGVILGGTKINIQIPPAVWAKVPAVPITATQGGWGPPNMFNPTAPVVLVGVKFASGVDPSVAWPSTPAGFPS